MFSNPLLSSDLTFETAKVSASAWLDGSADSRSKTFSSAGNSDRALISLWVRRTGFGASNSFLYAGTNSSNRFEVRFDNTDTLQVLNVVGGSTDLNLVSNAEYRDDAWYHIVFSYENGDGQLYVNGVEASYSVESQGTAGTDLNWNKAVLHEVGKRTQTNHIYFNGYIAQMLSLDGASIQNGDYAITDFGQEWPTGDNGSIWSPVADSIVVALANTVGGNSFCLTNAIGDGTDASTNANDFTGSTGSMSHAVNGSTNTPSNSFPIISELANDGGTISEGGMRYVSANSYNSAGVSILLHGGTWYWEVNVNHTDSSQSGVIGVTENLTTTQYSSWPGDNETDYVWYQDTGRFYDGGTIVLNGSNWETENDRIGVFYNADLGAMWFSLNGVLENGATVGEITSGTTTNAVFTGITAPVVPILGNATTTGGYDTDLTLMLDENSWDTPPPEAYLSLKYSNLATPTYQGFDHFNVVTYTGDGQAIGSGGQSITGVGFQPDFSWFKTRTTSSNNRLIDAVRGVTKAIQSDNTNSEANETEGLVSFDADGFTVGSQSGYNNSSASLVAWNWKANGSGVAITEGSTASTVSASEAGYFSIVQYTGTGTLATVGHGLPEPPEIVFIKNTSDSEYWTGFETIINGATHYITLDTHAIGISNNAFFNNTNPTSSVFTVNTNNRANGSGDNMIAYCFRSLEGLCRVLRYTGNGGDDGPFVYTGFKPRWVLAKCMSVSDTSHHWFVFDTARYQYNGTTTAGGSNGGHLEADNNVPEAAHSTDFVDNPAVDVLSNGFKLRTNSGVINGSGRIYLAIAIADIAGGGNLPPITGR